jgi:hypothetical protein
MSVHVFQPHERAVEATAVFSSGQRVLASRLGSTTNLAADGAALHSS